MSSMWAPMLLSNSGLICLVLVVDEAETTSTYRFLLTDSCTLVAHLTKDSLNKFAIPSQKHFLMSMYSWSNKDWKGTLSGLVAGGEMPGGMDDLPTGFGAGAFGAGAFGACFFGAGGPGAGGPGAGGPGAVLDKPPRLSSPPYCSW